MGASQTLSSWREWGIHKGSYTPFLLLLSIMALILILHYKLVFKKKKIKTSLPPGPRGLPIVGSLPFLDRNLHTGFTKLSRTYGSIFKIQIGSRVTIVLSSPSLVKELYRDLDTVFAYRGLSATVSVLSYGGNDITFSPYGDLWRMLRKVAVREFLNTATLEGLYDFRRKEVRSMVNQMYSNTGNPIEVGEYALCATFNSMTRVFWGDTLEADDEKRVNSEFREILEGVFNVIGALNVSDIFPVLAVFDIQGLEGKMKKLIQWFDQIFDFVFDKRQQSGGGGQKDLLQDLLQFKNQGEQKTPFTETHIKGLLLEFLLGGTRTQSTVIEWAMTELLKNPEIMEKAQGEIKEIVGFDNIVEEWHLRKLKYLDAVVKETLRLHPISPFIIKVAREDSMLGGYMIPKGCNLIVNAWALHRDPDVWDNPLEFRPERFLDSRSDANFSGKNFSYLPFGSGRRRCAGIPLVERFVPYLLASLLHSFNWKLPDATELDMSSTFGLELKKTVPLVAIPEPRLLDSILYA